ncbi:MAG: hypothetical protein RLZZ476_1639 [Verrucomicrobiota bacterium]|jgi:5-formyltetrahydrofolate cyclo-ligase
MPDPSLSTAKATLRLQLREPMRAVTPEAAKKLAELAKSWLLAHAKPLQTIAIYGGLRGEADLVQELTQWLLEKGFVPVVFAIQDETIVPKRVSSLGDVFRGKLGAWEPAPNTPEIAISALDVIWVPGLAFSAKTGFRLGRGGGYYDRLLSDPACRARKVALAHDFQLVDDIPHEPHDQRVDEILTLNHV